MPLLPLKTYAGPNTPLFAPASGGGGGGGGDGPNPSFSSITLAAGPSGFPNIGPGVITFTNAIGFNNLPDQMTANLYSPASGAVGWELTTPANDGGIIIGGDGSTSFINSLYSRPIQIGIQGGGAPVFMSSLTVSSINGAVPGGGGGVSGGIAVSSITSFLGDATSTITMAPGPGGQVVISGAPLTGGNDISFETSIPGNSVSQNYQPGADANAIIMRNPGNTNGGLNLAALTAGGAVIAASAAASGSPSSLTITSDSVKLLQPTALGASLNIFANDPNLYAINCVSSSVALAGLSIGQVGGRNQVYADTGEVPNFFTSTIKGSTGQISLNPSGTEQIRIGGAGAPGDITVATVGGGNINLTGPVVQTSGSASFSGAASISSLTVSSINGSLPGGGPTRTTVNSVATGTILGDGTLTIVSDNFTTLAGHLYSLDGWLFATASPNISSNASLALQIGNIDRAYQSAIPLWGYSAAGGLAYGNNIPVSFTWRAASGAVNNVINAQMVDAQGAAVSTFINAVNGLMLVDYGPVA